MKIFFLIFIVFSGCMVGPKYDQPDVAMPEEFVEKKNDETALADLKNWWKSFDDPQLDHFVDIAIENNYNLQIALEKIEETRAFYRIKKADLFPEIDMTASAVRYGVSQNLVQTSLIPQSTYNVFQVGFDAIWELDLFGKVRREKRAAFYEMQSMQENMRDVYVTIISDVARYYIDICAIQSIMDLLKEKIDYQTMILELMKDRNIHGIDSQIAPEQEIAILQEETEKLIFYSTSLKQTIYRLAVLLGMQPEKITISFLKCTKIPQAENKVKIGMPSSLLRNRPDIRKAERQLASTTEKIGAAIAEYFPSFSLTGDSNLKTSKLQDLFSSKSFAWSFGSLMNWPIITFGRIRANVDVKKSQEKQALLFYENTILDALKDVEGSLIAYFNEQEKLKNVQEELQAVAEITYLEESKYLNGISNYIDYLEQEKNLLEKKIKKVESERTLSHNLIALYKALGGGEW